MAEKRTTLDDIADQVMRIDEMVGYLPGLVRTARLQGATWKQIGEALGITPQGAQKTYGPMCRDL